MSVRARVGVLALRGGQMGIMLLVTQLTFELYPAAAFLFFNQLLFLAALHTCLTYGVQVQIWSGVRSSMLRLLARGAGTALLIAAAYGLYARPGYDALLFAAVLLYLLARFLDRVFFNAAISLRAPTRAYAGTIVFSALELVALLGVLALVLPWPLQRFLLPALLMLPLAGWLAWRAYGELAAPTGAEAGQVRTLAPALHAFCILAVAMSDRVLIDHVPLAMADKAVYLLQFTYAGALYTLLMSLFEVRRPELFDKARATPGVLGYVHASGGMRFFLLMAAAGVAALGVGAVYFGGFVPATGFAPALSWGLLVLYFLLLVVLAYVQAFFLARERYRPLFASWAVALGIKLGGVALGGVMGLLIGNIVAVAAGVVVAVWLGKGKGKADAD